MFSTWGYLSFASKRETKRAKLRAAAFLSNEKKKTKILLPDGLIHPYLAIIVAGLIKSKKVEALVEHREPKNHRYTQ